MARAYGALAQQILSCSETWAIDLVILSSCGETGLKCGAFGTTLHTAVKHLFSAWRRSEWLDVAPASGGNQSRSFAYHLAWSGFRRAHQALVRLYHYKRRYALIRHLQL